MTVWLFNRDNVGGRPGDSDVVGAAPKARQKFGRMDLTLVQ